MRTPPSVVSSTLFSGSREMSINREGRSTSSFIKSIKLVPPAMNFAVGSAVICRTASADVAAHQFTDLVGGLRLALCHEPDGGADLSRCAVAALERVVVDERLL